MRKGERGRKSQVGVTGGALRGWALRVREEFAEMIEQAMQGNVVLSGRLDAVCEAFETDLGDVFNVSCVW